MSCSTSTARWSTATGTATGSPSTTPSPTPGLPYQWGVERNGLLATTAAELPSLVVVNDYTREEDLSGATLLAGRFEAVTATTLGRLVRG